MKTEVEILLKKGTVVVCCHAGNKFLLQFFSDSKLMDLIGLNVYVNTPAFQTIYPQNIVAQYDPHLS